MAVLDRGAHIQLAVFGIVDPEADGEFQAIGPESP